MRHIYHAFQIIHMRVCSVACTGGGQASKNMPDRQETGLLQLPAALLFSQFPAS